MKTPVKTLSGVLVLAVLTTYSIGCPDPDRRPDTRTGTEARRAISQTSVANVQPDEDPSAVVAKIGDETITLAEIDEDLAAELHQTRMEYRQRVYQIRRGGIDRAIAQRLFAEEAKRMGLDDEEAFINQAVEKGTPFPSDEEARAFYEENRQMMGDQSFEAIQPRVTQFLHQRKKQERFNQLLEDLREKAGVEVLLSEPRVVVQADGPSKGPDEAPITIVEFSDFLCPFCIRGKEVMDEVKEAYGDNVRFVFRFFPSMENENAARAAEAAVCADLQDKFWEMHGVLFASGRAFSAEQIEGHARGIEGIDIEKFQACMSSGAARERIQADIAAGRSAGVGGTPAFFVNGIPVLGAQPFETFKEIIDEELSRAD